MAEEAGSHDYMKPGVHHPHDQVHNDEEDGVVAVLTGWGGQAAIFSSERDLEDSKDPREDESDNSSPPADLADPPAEQPAVTAEVQEPGNEFDNGCHKVGDKSGEVGGGGPSVGRTAEEVPEPSDRHRADVVCIFHSELIGHV